MRPRQWCSFIKDSDGEIDKAESEVEEWIEYLKRSTATAIGRMKAAQNPMLDWNTQENEMALGNDNCFASRWTMGKESSLKPCTQDTNPARNVTFLQTCDFSRVVFHELVLSSVFTCITCACGSRASRLESQWSVVFTKTCVFTLSAAWHTVHLLCWLRHQWALPHFSLAIRPFDQTINGTSADFIFWRDPPLRRSNKCVFQFPGRSALACRLWVQRSCRRGQSSAGC